MSSSELGPEKECVGETQELLTRPLIIEGAP
jgi:hypothetical protein